MLLVALLIGAVLIVSAIRNSQATLFSSLAEDVPGFVVWGAAILAVGAIGYIPGLKPASRGLLALVIVVIIMDNYQAILSGFAASNKAAAAQAAHPAAASPPGATQTMVGGGGSFGGAGSSASWDTAVQVASAAAGG